MTIIHIMVITLIMIMITIIIISTEELRPTLANLREAAGSCQKEGNESLLEKSSYNII